jgi:hypothetical protein
MCEWAEAADRIAPPPVAYSLLTGDPTEVIGQLPARDGATCS